MKTLLSLVLVAACLHMGLACAASAENGSDDLRVQLLSPLHAEIDPGTVLTAPVLVSNISTREMELFERIGLPQGWQIITPQEASFTLAGERQQVRLLVVRVPASCPQGQYDLNYSLSRSPGDGLSSTAVFSATVRRAQRFELSVVEGSETIIAGDPYEAEVHLVNTGNCGIHVRLSGTTVPNTPLEISPNTLLLPPSKNALVRLQLKTPPHITARVRQIIRIDAVAEDVLDSAVSTSRVISFDIVPGVHSNRDVYHRVPTETRLTAATEDGRQRLQVSLSANGTLDDRSSRHVDLLLCGPDMEGVGKYGRQDQYRLRYRDDLVGFTVGDQTYSLSPLTQRSLYGRGAEVNIHHDKAGTGCFFMEPQGQGSEVRKFGGFAECRPNMRFGLRGNALVVKADTSTAGLDQLSQVYSLALGIMPTKMIDCNLEYGFSTIAGEEKTQDHAYRIETHGKPFEGIRYSFEKIHAAPDYAGYYRNADFTFGTLTLPLPAKLEANIAVHSSTTDPMQDTPGIRRRNLRTGISGPLLRAIKFTLDYGVFRTSSLPTATAADFAEKTFRLGLGRSAARVSVQGYAEGGRLERGLPESRGSPLERFGLSTYFRPNQHHTYAIRASTGHPRFADDPERETSAAVSGRWQFKESLDLAVEYVANLKNSQHAHHQNNIFLSLTYTLPGGQRLIVRGYLKTEKDEGDRNASLFLTYAFPHNLRVSREKGTGTLKGTVYDHELAAQSPLPGVVLIVDGMYAVAGEGGKFVFPALTPGIHYLRIEQNSIGFDRTTTAGLPLPVEISAGRTTDIEIGVVTACRLAGQVSLFETGNQHNLRYATDPRSAPPDRAMCKPPGGGDGELTEVRGLTQVLIEITDGEESLSQMTDQSGRFSFDNLRPGRWTVRLHSHGLPDHHHHENPEIVIGLRPGEDYSLWARVVPDDRPIQIIDTGEIRSARR